MKSRKAAHLTAADTVPQPVEGDVFVNLFAVGEEFMKYILVNFGPKTEYSFTGYNCLKRGLHALTVCSGVSRISPPVAVYLKPGKEEEGVYVDRRDLYLNYMRFLDGLGGGYTLGPVTHSDHYFLPSALRSFANEAPAFNSETLEAAGYSRGKPCHLKVNSCLNRIGASIVGPYLDRFETVTYYLEPFDNRIPAPYTGGPKPVSKRDEKLAVA